MDIKAVDEALKLHSSYSGNYNSGVGPRGSKYLRHMDSLAYNYPGAPGIALSNMLDDYYRIVGVRNLDEAFERLRKLEDGRNI